MILAILLLPVCIGAGQTLWMVMRACGGADITLVPDSRRRGLLGRDLSAATQADVDLRLRPRIDARAVGLAVRRAA